MWHVISRIGKHESTVGKLDQVGMSKDNTTVKGSRRTGLKNWTSFEEMPQDSVMAGGEVNASVIDGHIPDRWKQKMMIWCSGDCGLSIRVQHLRGKQPRAGFKYCLMKRKLPEITCLRAADRATAD